MEDLQDAILLSIIVKTGAKCTGKLGCVSQRWHSLASDDHLWCHFCSQDFNISSRVDPTGSPCSSYKETYEKWHEAFYMYPLSIVRRAKDCWDIIRNWTSIHFPEVANTLVPGASEDEIRRAEDQLGWQLPVSTRILYRFCNGQNIPHGGLPQTQQLSALGVMGGYHFYTTHVNVRLLPLQEVLELTELCASLITLPRGLKHIVIAASCNMNKMNKFFFLDCSDGQLYVGTKNLFATGEMMPCVASSLIDVAQQDAMLLWLEEYGRQLEVGNFSVHKDGKDSNIWSISLFPEKEPLCSEAVTNGVQVRASAVFVPEESNLLENGDGYFFCYSIRMCLLHQEKISEGGMLSSCQLARRHWIIRANDTIINDFHGDAVIGKYPYLKEGGDVFVYQSCCPLRTSSGSIEGDFTFVPGRLSKPNGPEFSVRVAQFPLQIPQYIF